MPHLGTRGTLGRVMVNLAVLWTVGVIAAIPVILWWARDVTRIPSPTWFWTGHHRRHWQWGVLFGWLAGGWPAIVIVLVWAHSAERRDLLDEAADARKQHRDHHHDGGSLRF